MKNVKEFIQRLQDDPEFEKNAQVYENSDEFMQFVRREGYDFTLDQLLDEFQPKKGLPQQSENRSLQATKSVEEFIQRLEDDAEFEKKARAYENNDSFMEFVKSEGYNFSLEQLINRLKPGKGILKPQEKKPPLTPKPAHVPIQRIPGGAAGQKEDKGSQRRPGAPGLKFDGGGGGRRRGIKWRNE